MKRIFALLMFGMIIAGPMAQTSERFEVDQYNAASRTPEPFSFSVTTLTPEDLKWSMRYSGGYGERVEGPFGYDGVSQQFAVKGYLGNRFTVYANAGLGIPRNGNITSAQQALS